MFYLDAPPCPKCGSIQVLDGAGKCLNCGAPAEIKKRVTPEDALETLKRIQKGEMKR